MSAFAHLALWSDKVVSDSAFRTMIDEERNPYRWLEYVFSSTLMLIVICVLLGVNNLSTLIAVSGCNVAMVLFGDIGSRFQYDRTQVMTGRDISPKNAAVRKNKILSFMYGSIAGVTPWIIIGLQVAQSGVASAGAIPWFVWSIVFSIFGLFFSFAVIEGLNIWYKLEFKKTEYRYRIASFAAKSALSWQAFAALYTLYHSL